MIGVWWMNWMLEYFYQKGLRRGDIICILIDYASNQLQISDLDNNEPLIQLYDYSLNILTTLSDNTDKFEDF